MNDNQAICLKCGVKKTDGKNFCSNCGGAVAENAAFCLNCGVEIKRGGNLAGQDKTLIAVICFFLGGFGIHNFIMGETKKGIAKIIFSFLCGIGGILALVDFVKILMDKYEVDPDKMF